MKKWFNKIKTNFKNATKGFSLVELIVVIAIMAVMAAVLVPALLGYVEKSRARKDDSAMSEVTNAIQLSLADMDIYDEALQFAVKDNYSCYCDGDTSTNTDANKILTKEPDLWLFNDNARLLDETVYKPAGKMRGVTVTLKPNGKAEYILKDGIVNQIGDDSTKKGTNAGKVLNDCPELYNRLRSTVGDTIKVSSQTYRNSDYTIFISMGTTGGNQADKQDAIQVYGQYNGTNLPEVAPGVPDAGQNGAPSEQPGGPSESVDSGPNVEQLQEKHQFKYYSTFNGAVADVNANTIGVNADATKDSATAGIYTDNGETFVVLLKDTTETSKVTVTADMTINLGGNILNFSSNTGITNTKDNQNTINIDGRLKNSTITSNVHSVYWKSGNINIDGGIYISTTESDTIASIRVENATSTIENCTISATSDNGGATGVYFKKSTGTVKNSNISSKSKDNKSQCVFFAASSTGTIENCTILATTENTRADGIIFQPTDTVLTVKNSNISAKIKDGTSYGITFNSGTTGTIENCTITAHANYVYDNGTYTASSMGLYGGVNSTIGVKNCNISGIHAGIETLGSLNVDGGTYEGFGHGGFYFAGAGTTSYVKNATIRECAMPDGYTNTVNSNYTGFYVGGNDNITVYMDRCNFYGSRQAMVLRGSSGEVNNSVYMSNSNINKDNTWGWRIRIDNSTHKLYLGKGNNFTIEDCKNIAENTVITTNEVYCQ